MFDVKPSCTVLVKAVTLLKRLVLFQGPAKLLLFCFDAERKLLSEVFLVTDNKVFVLFYRIF